MGILDPRNIDHFCGSGMEGPGLGRKSATIPSWGQHIFLCMVQGREHGLVLGERHCLIVDQGAHKDALARKE